jgi:hypothetical protein
VKFGCLCYKVWKSWYTGVEAPYKENEK